jgi:hypothetical protein
VTDPDDGEITPLDTRRRLLLLYAERPRRRTRQMLADVLVAAWVVVIAWWAVTLHDIVLGLQAPGRGLADAGGRVSGAFTDAAGAADGVPLVGERLARALGGGTRAGQSLVDAGTTQVEAAAAAATGLAWLVIVVAAVPVAAVWLVLRVRWVIAARRLLVARDGRRADPDLLALRALATAAPNKLTRSVPGAADGWRRGDPHVVARLADLTLADHGLRGPTLIRRGS